MSSLSDAQWSPSGRALKRRGLRDDVYERVFRQLLAGAIPPGTKLRVENIARELGVSPTPVREALVQLERTGLVTREAGKGYRVSPPLTASQMGQLFDARLMLETTATRLAATSSAELVSDLEASQKRHRTAGEALITGRAAGNDDVDLATEYLAADTAFHDVIFRGCGNNYLLEMSVNLGAQIHRMRQVFLRGTGDVKESIREHQTIVEAFSSGDPKSPEAAMRTHIERVREREMSHARPE